MWDESCGLVLSLGHANRVYEKLADAHDWLPTPDMPGEWFVSLHTYTGPVAENLRLTSADDGETPEPAVPGKAAAAPRTRSGGPPPSATAVPRSTP